MDLIDISRPLSPATAVWPGDQPVEHSWTALLEQGESVNLSAFRMSAHAGTHVDAPLHVREDGDSTETLDLSAFIGRAEVIAVEDADTVRPSHVKSVNAPRVLFKTPASHLSAEEWPDTITSIHPDTVSLLEEKDVCLIGTDAPSVDPLDSTELSTHHALIDAGIVNLEGLCLSSVSPGSYSLFSLPIKLQAGDAAPIRAVLGDDSLL